MANTAQGTVWNLPNYTGELFTADMVNTPLLSMIGGLKGGSMTNNFEFPTDTTYAHETIVQETITETESLTPPTAISYVRAQDKNVTQIFMEQVSLTYVRMSNQGRLQGINTAGAGNPIASEMDFQIATALEAIARKVEWHFLQGTYAIATTAGTPNQTRGLIPLCAGTSTVAAAGAKFSKELLDQIMLEMFTNGALFRNPVIFCNGFQRQQISDKLGYQPEDRNISGISVSKIITDFGNLSVAPAHRMMPTDTILIADMSVLDTVFQPVPTKGNLFYEELARTGAGVSGQIFGQIGLNHGPAFAHGTITGLSIS